MSAYYEKHKSWKCRACLNRASYSIKPVSLKVGTAHQKISKLQPPLSPYTSTLVKPSDFSRLRPYEKASAFTGTSGSEVDPRLYQALVTDFKWGWDLSFRDVWDVQRPASLPPVRMHSVRKPPPSPLLPSFFSLSSFHCHEYMTECSHCRVNTPQVMFSTCRPLFLNRSWICWQTPGIRTLNYKLRAVWEQTASVQKIGTWVQ